MKRCKETQNGPHHRTWAQSQRSGHYSDSPSVYTVRLQNTFESIDSGVSLVGRLSGVPPAACASQSQAFYGDLLDMS
ncbi:hypothetical protein MRX96_002716 [Rhipicephalus microplus]